MPTTLTRGRPRQGGYLSKMCGYKIALDNMPNTYPPDLKKLPSVFLQDLFDGGNAFEERIGQLLTEQMKASELAYIVEQRDPNGERTTEGKRAKEEDTFAAYLNPEVRIIWNARIGSRFEELLSEHLGTDIRDEKRISEPDAIALGETMANGLRAMRFIDVKWHKITSGKSVNPKRMWVSDLSAPYKDGWVEQRDFYGTIHDEDWRQLAHYHRHALTLGTTAPDPLDGGAWAAVIGKEEVAVWGDLDQLQFGRKRQTALSIYDADFAEGLAIVDNAAEADTDKNIPVLAFPEWKTDCEQCEWLTVCKGQLQAHGRGGHVTLLPGITPVRAVPLYNAGITDVATLAARDPLGDPNVPETYVYQARVTLDGNVHLALDVEALDLPRADIEVDFDCESESTVYMWGVRVNRHDASGQVQVTEHMLDDYTRTEDGERDVFVKVWALFQDLITEATNTGRSIRLYHYTRYERTQMIALARKYAGQPGVPSEDQVEDLFDSGAIVDLYEVLAKQLVWPTMSHTIKKLAVHAGFAWRDETPGGDMSMLWYRAACSDPNPDEREANLQRLRRYNLDDVHAQAYLRDWVNRVPLPKVTELGPPKAATTSA